MSAPVLLEILPLALGAAVSPLVVAGEIYCISEPTAGLRRGWLFTAGSALVVGIWLAIGQAMGHALPLMVFFGMAAYLLISGIQAL